MSFTQGPHVGPRIHLSERSYQINDLRCDDILYQSFQCYISVYRTKRLLKINER